MTREIFCGIELAIYDVDKVYTFFLDNYKDIIWNFMLHKLCDIELFLYLYAFLEEWDCIGFIKCKIMFPYFI